MSNSSKRAPVFFFCGSLGFFCRIFKILCQLHVGYIEFSYVTILCKSARYSKHGKMLNCSKFIIVNFTLLSNIDRLGKLIFYF